MEEAESLEKVAALSRDLRQDKPQPLAWEDIPLVERLSVSLGYKLVGLVNDAGGSPLPLRIRGVRQTLSEQLGFLLPEVHIRDSLRLKARSTPSTSTASASTAPNCTRTA